MQFRLAYCLLAFVLSGCVLNNVRRVDSNTLPGDGRAILIYGIAIDNDGHWDYPVFSPSLVEYDLDHQVGTGNCFIFNRTVSSITPVPGSRQYFAFDVPAGNYSFTPFFVGHVDFDEEQTFSAPAGRVVYVGDFVLTNGTRLVLRRDYEAALVALRSPSPISLAVAIPARAPQIFLCTP